MSIQLSTLNKRIITAIILIVITLSILFFIPPAGFAIVTGMIALWGIWEWTYLMGLKRFTSRLFYLLITFVLTLQFVLISLSAYSQLFLLVVSFIWWLVATLLVILYPKGSFIWGKSILVRGFMGLLVFIPCWFAINYIRNQKDGELALLFLFVLIWGADTAAYFVGKKWGKTQLAPMVSPGKTIQGFIGALLFSIIFALSILWLNHIPIHYWLWDIALVLITVSFSVIGDLFESMLKRQAGLKDSSQLLPGHGGLLDRIDSLTAAAPIFALGATLLGIYLS